VRELLRLAPALFSFAACGSSPSPSLLLVTLDTVRADRLGSYGSARGLTPYLDRFASESIRFEDVTCQTPLTTPSHASILTGLLPSRHGIRNNESFRLSESMATLATVLRASGYRTAAFIGAFPLASRFGLARGFDVYDEEFLRRSPRQERSAAEVLAAAGRFIQEDAPRDAPFFVWIHLFDAHTPYEPPAPFRDRFPDDAYGGEIAYIDDALGKFLERIPREDVIVSVLSDHGEGLGEHGEQTHGALLYESTIRVPWIVRLPGSRFAGTSIGTPVRTIDVAPTLLGLLKAPPLPDPDGHDLSPFLERGDVPSLSAYSESLYLHLLLGWGELSSLKRGALKVVVGPAGTELYDLDRDPGETDDIAADRREDAEKLLEELGTIERSSPAKVAEPDPETAERLEALGYVTGSTRPDGREMDPRAGMLIWREIETGTSLLARDRAAARKHFERALELDPWNGLALKSLGDLALGEGEAERAHEIFEAAVASGFFHPDLDLSRARTFLLLGRLDEASALVDRFLAGRPDSADALVVKGRVLRAQGRREEAAAELRRALEYAPEHAHGLNELGSTLAELGRREEARAAFERAIAAAPLAPEPRRNLARLVDGANAERLRREAIELDPGYAEARIDLARQLAETGRAAEAAAEIEAAFRLRPDDPQALFIAARVAELQGRNESARRLYERFLRVAPAEMSEAREMARGRLAALRAKP
jgi:arylsulfatase A-like enzyme/Tfp pilus assembly protein PilF